MLAELSMAAATALVQATVADGWAGVRHKVARLFGRGKPDPTIERRLDATRRQLADAPNAELDHVRAKLAAEWQTRFADLLADHPDAEPELAAMVEELRPVIAAATGHSVAAAGNVNVSADRASVAAAVIHGDVIPPDPRPPGPASD